MMTTTKSLVIQLVFRDLTEHSVIVNLLVYNVLCELLDISKTEHLW